MVHLLVKALAEFSLARTFLEDVLCHRQRREDVRPTGVEGKLCKDLRGLRLRETVIHRPVEVIRDLGDLARRYQGADSDQAPIPGRKVRTQPEVPEKHICGVLHYSGCHAAELLADPRRPVRLRGFIEREKLGGSCRQLIAPDLALRKDFFRSARSGAISCLQLPPSFSRSMKPRRRTGRRGSASSSAAWHPE